VSDYIAVLALLAEYGGRLDAGAYDDWLGLFAAECLYSVMPRENDAQGLPIALISCTKRAALEDRILALQQANKYNIHTDRHLIGLPRVTGIASGSVAYEASFTVHQTDQEGDTRLFATGLYRGRLLQTEHTLKIAAVTVLLDTFAVPSLLATPL